MNTIVTFYVSTRLHLKSSGLFLSELKNIKITRMSVTNLGAVAAHDQSSDNAVRRREVPAEQHNCGTYLRRIESASIVGRIPS